MLNIPANALVALAAAATWGGGDFSGGMGVKHAGGMLRGALRVIVTAHTCSLVVLVAVVLLQGMSLPSGPPLYWALGAGVAAGLSLAAFYLALAKGAMGASAAVSGLLAAGIPAIVSGFLEGAPTWIQSCGFAVAFVAIWLIAAGGEEGSVATSASTGTMGLAIFGGVGFGVYFVALERANTLGILQPMLLARVGSIVTCVALLIFTRNPQKPDPPLNSTARLWILGVAVLDTAGNLLFITATRLGRLDAAAVLASLYPASTILLAAWQLHERPRRKQTIGMLLALSAVVLITV